MIAKLVAIEKLVAVAIVRIVAKLSHWAVASVRMVSIVRVVVRLVAKLVKGIVSLVVKLVAMVAIAMGRESVDKRADFPCASPESNHKAINDDIIQSI